MSSELNPMQFKTASAYLEYILQSEGDIMWMHFDEAQRIESEAKDEALDKGFADGALTAIKMIRAKLQELEINLKDNEQ
jgi:hypothetical protein